jgi:HPr kinase/phosphorylase
MQPGKAKQIGHLTVADFYKKYADLLGLRLICCEEGLQRRISEPTVNRPGLALAGFFTYFARRRMQVLGNSEMSYLKSLTPELRLERFGALCDANIPCLVLSRGARLERALLAAAQARGLSVFTSPMVTMKFINKATLRLEWEFAPITSEHGCMVDVSGIGVLVRGESGTGKSEAALGLVERGASLVADDLVHLRLMGSDLIGSSPPIGRGLMEVRGLGIMNVVSLFGVRALRTEKRLDVVVSLRPQSALNEVDRLGARRQMIEFLGVGVPHVELPVAPGRDMARLVEVAALDQKLRSYGYDVAEEFNRRLIEAMNRQQDQIH